MRAYQINSHGASDLFQMFEQSGLLSSDRITTHPLLRILAETTWNKLMQIDNELFKEASYKPRKKTTVASIFFWKNRVRKKTTMASVSVWKKTPNGYQGGAMFSTKKMPDATLGLLKVFLHQLDYVAGNHAQWWFDRNVVFSFKHFGPKTVSKLKKDLGPHLCDSRSIQYCLIDLTQFYPTPPLPTVECYNVRHAHEFQELVTRIRGEIYLKTEELDTVDIRLNELDTSYQAAGLRRCRMIYLAYLEPTSPPVGAIIINKGPIGISLSCLENSLDMMIDPTLNDIAFQQVLESLMAVGVAHNLDFPGNRIPVITDEKCGELLASRYRATGVKEFIRFSIVAGAQPVIDHYQDLFKATIARLENRELAQKRKHKISALPFPSLLKKRA